MASFFDKQTVKKKMFHKLKSVFPSRPDRSIAIVTKQPEKNHSKKQKLHPVGTWMYPQRFHPSGSKYGLSVGRPLCFSSPHMKMWQAENRFPHVSTVSPWRPRHKIWPNPPEKKGSTNLKRNSTENCPVGVKRKTVRVGWRTYYAYVQGTPDDPSR